MVSLDQKTKGRNYKIMVLKMTKIQKHKQILTLLSCLFFCKNVFAQIFVDSEMQLRATQWADSVFDTMSSDEKIGQLFMLTVSPSAVHHSEMLSKISRMKPGGLLFSKGSIDEQAESTNIYQRNSRIPLFIALDGEWGLSMRLDGTPRFPRNMMLGAVGDLNLIRLYGAEVGRECREMGIHINFAPVIDVNDNPRNPVIGTRSFGENPKQVADRAIAYSAGLESKNVFATAKHFPGHGDTSEDSHETLPLVGKTREQLEEIEIFPFRRFIEDGFSMVMTGHLSVPALDNRPSVPASLSSRIVGGYLRNTLGFKGLAITDALAMKGASRQSKSVCVEALKAGNDILLNPSDPLSEFAAVRQAVENGEISMTSVEEKCLKVLFYKYLAGLSQQKSVERKDLSLRINTERSRWLVQKLNEAAITLLKNDGDVIPLKDLGGRKMALLLLTSGESDDFRNIMLKYGNFAVFTLSPSAGKARIDEVFARLKNYGAVVCSVHSAKQSDLAALKALAADRELHLCFFISPYSLEKFRGSIAAARSVTLAYEDSPMAQHSAAEAIMGGIAMRGKIPVSTGTLFRQGEGLTTEKVRLAYQSPLEAGMSAEGLMKIESIVREGIAAQAFPGCQVLIARRGAVVYSRSFGHFDYAGTHRVENDDIYDLASVTKALATLPAVMKLYDQKKISLSDRVGRFVPALKNTDKEAITIRELLYHESRLPAFLPFFQLLIDKNSYDGNLLSKRRTYTHNVRYDTDTYARTDFKFLPGYVSRTATQGIDRQVADNFFIKSDFDVEVMAEIANATLRSRGGYLYSDLNFMLLKEAVETISGSALDRFVEEEFFSRLGACHTTFLPLRRFDRKHIAPTENDMFWRNQILTGHVHDEAAAVLGGVSGNAGLFSNADDLAKIIYMLLNLGRYGGEELLSPATVRLFTETKSPNSRRGLGFDRPDPDPDRSPAGSLAPQTVFGHTGYTGTCFWADPASDLIYIFLSNRVYPSRTHKQISELKIRGRIQDAVYEAIIN
jgi:beta-glucosidase-like glycosyl hydrolase/CubicO group peptidase (beta-lactamase class C family)